MFLLLYFVNQSAFISTPKMFLQELHGDIYFKRIGFANQIHIACIVPVHRHPKEFHSKILFPSIKQIKFQEYNVKKQVLPVYYFCKLALLPP